MQSISINSSSKSATGLLLFSLLIFGSCKKDDPEPQDAISPEISLSGVADQASVWNTVPLTLSATDASGIAKIEIYVDGVLVSTLTAPPYALSWDSNGVTDGAHSIKGVAYDNSGNKSEKMVSVTVKNILVSINVAANQLSSNVNRTGRGFVFLSDENGKLISATEYKNNDKVVLKNPDFNGKYFFLTEATIEKSHNYLTTYAQIERGKNWVLSFDQEPEEPVYTGTATINFLNAQPGGYIAVSNGSKDNAISEAHTTGTFSLRKSPSKLFVSLHHDHEEGPSKYALYSGITVGTNTVNLATVTTDFVIQDVTLPDKFDDSNVSVYGLPVANNFDEYYSLGSYYNNNSQSLRLYYPGSAFPMYYFSYNLAGDDIFYEKRSTHEIFKIDPIKNDISFSFKENKLTYSASGDFDFFAFLIVQTDATWIYVLPEGNGILPTFGLPPILDGFKIPVQGVLTGHAVLDHENMNNYEDLMSSIRKSNGGLRKLFEFGANFSEVDYLEATTGGRRRPHSLFTGRVFKNHHP